MQIFTNVELTRQARERLARRAAPDTVYFADPDTPRPADRDALLRSEVAFGSSPPELLPSASGLRWLQLDSVGCDQYRGLPWASLGTRLTVTNLRGFFAAPVAETGIAGVLALYRGIGQLAGLQRQRAWRDLGFRSGLRTLSGAHALVVGYGAIGRALTERLTAFGSTVQTYGTVPSGAGLTTLTELDQAIPAADLVFLALPETASTTGLFGAARLALLRQDAMLVNLGRGALVDEQALAAMLGSSAIAGAVLDVTGEEPLPRESPLWQAPNVLLTQHTAGGSVGELEGKTEVFLANLTRYRAGHPLTSVVDWAKGY